MITQYEYQSYDAMGLAELVSSNEVSASELLDAALSAVQEIDPFINSIVHVFEGRARALIAAGIPKGPFNGVPFVLKDLLADVAGIPTTMGSRYCESHIPKDDAELTRRYNQAGLVIFAKTNTPEFGGSCTTEPQLHGATRNPWNVRLSAGGSSGGSGAAVAARLVPMAHGNDGGGSLRIPGSANGVFALKPTRGRNPTGPNFGEQWGGLIEEHALTRSVRDSAALLDATSGPDIGAPYRAPNFIRSYLEQIQSAPRRLRIGMAVESPSGVPIDPVCRKAVEITANILSSLGHEVDEVSPNFDHERMGKALVTVIAVNYLTTIMDREAEIGRPPDAAELERVIWHRLEIARRTSASEYALAIRDLHRSGRQFNQFFVDRDIHLTPTLARPPQPLGTFDMNSDDVAGYLSGLYGYIPFTAIYNATGNPACTIPMHWTDDNIPIGIQLGAGFGREDLLFQIAAQLEVAQPWQHRRPSFLT